MRSGYIICNWFIVMRQFSVIISAILLMTVVGCQNDYAKKAERLKSKVPQLEELVVSLASEKKKRSVLYIANDFQGGIRSQIENLNLPNLQYIIIKSSDCKNHPSLELIFGRNEHITFECDPPNEYEENGFIKVYPLYKGWIYWINTDLIG